MSSISKNILIVEMQPEHVEQVAKIERASFGRGNAAVSYEVWTEKSYLEDIYDKSCKYICAMAYRNANDSLAAGNAAGSADSNAGGKTDENTDTEVAGYCGMRTVLDEGHITKIAVKKEYRKLGIGEQLMTELLNIGSQCGITYYELEVRKSNTAAQKLYEKFGFEKKGCRLGYYSDNKEDAYIYTKGRTSDYTQ